MVNEMIRYEAACRAVAESHRVDEAKDIRDKHIAIAMYARQSKNFELEKQAMEIRLRAERKGGQLLIELKPIRETGHGSTKKSEQESVISEKSESPKITPKKPESRIFVPKKQNLIELGVDKYLSSQMQKLAKMPEDLFEQHIGIEKDKIDKKQEYQIKSEIRSTEQKANEEKRRLAKIAREKKEEEKRKTQEAKEEYHRKIDESGLPFEYKEKLKGQKMPPLIDTFAFDFTTRLAKDEEKLEEIMYNWEHLNIFTRHTLASALNKLGNYYIKCAEKLKKKEHVPKLLDLQVINNQTKE